MDSRFSVDYAVGTQGWGSVISPLMTNVDLDAYNFDVTALDPNSGSNPFGGNHAWPYELYARSAGATTNNPAPQPLTAIGPVLSAVWSGETNANTWLSSVPANLRLRRVRCVVNGYNSQGWGGAGCTNTNWAESGFDTPLVRLATATVAPSDASVTRNVCAGASTAAPATGFALSLNCPAAAAAANVGKLPAGAVVTTAVPAQATLRYTVSLTEMANEFTASATYSAADSSAVLSLFVDDVLVWVSQASLGNVAETSEPIAITPLQPGQHYVQWVLSGSMGSVDVTQLRFQMRSTAPVYAAQGVCGPSHSTQTALANAPTVGLCAAGAPSKAEAAGDSFRWTCGGSANTVTSVMQCSAPIASCDRDIDGDGSFDAAIDGVLLNRFLMGFRGNALIDGLSIPGPRRTSDAITAFIDSGAKYELFSRSLGTANALQDGLLHLRIMRGESDAALFGGIGVPATATATTPAAVRANALAGCRTPVVQSVPQPSLSIDTTSSALSALGAIFPVATAYSFVPGLSGRTAVKLNGVTNPGAIRIPNTAAMQFNTGATIDLWARIDGDSGMNGFGQAVTSGWAMALVAKSHDAGSVSLNAFANDPNYSGTGYGFAAWASSVSGWGTGPCTIVNRNPGAALGTWFRLTATASTSGGTRIYYNKRLIYACPNAVPDFTDMNAEDLYIGKYSDAWYPLDGAVQDIRIYQQALTDAEVQALP